ncbi:c-type cytochrome biogenesis protein CcmI [Bartonella sp. HY329]|uniref:c-type cytochrome biogenesis protein CcmI n=1 Tax=unclassified Bartonella TaxID=2645622 RepID=UPI0021C59F79|nr:MULTISPECIES: c-type cytochrome biogenesis protein CcmI [unclassified Bartonella]UXM96287.1 c-type cytochrome biogenesis protein CcmI [Bartonella sp. HY329]UXN10611.1 c-type cytochrome biogenesis protein CcmI [Bartonella sp. HY328]
MFFWFILTLITIGVVFWLVHALGKDVGFSVSRSNDNIQSDIAVYKTQLIEINEEEENNQISPENAKEARLELARRILAREKTAYKFTLNNYKDANNRFLQRVLFTGVLLIITASWGMYFLMGNPDLPQKPFEVLMAKNDDTLDLNAKIVKSEALLARDPSKGSLLDALGEYYLEAGRFRDAVNILNRSLSVNGESAERFLNYGVALMALENGVVTKDAESAFHQAIKLGPENPQARIFLARGLIQNGQQQQAIALLEKFVEDHGDGQIWVKDMQQVIEQLKETEPQPTLNLTKEQHDLIANNIGNLEEKLKGTPQDVEAWLMLLNAYFLLEQPEKVTATYNNALEVLSPENRKRLIKSLTAKGFSAAAIKGAR